MLNFVQVLERILPESNQVFYHGLALGGARPIPRQCFSPEEVFSAGLSWSGSGLNAYYAPAGFSGGLKRNESCASLVRALWLDIDYAKPRAFYATIDDALVDLFAFVYELGLPQPLIINSGRGLHVYWPFSRDISKADWLWLVKLFKRAVNKFKLGVDPNYHMDSLSSVLRIPGTLNYGSDGVARQVSLLQDGEIGQPELIGANLFRYVGEEPEFSPPTQGSIDIPGTNFGSILQRRTKSDPLPIVKECAQVRLAGDSVASRNTWLYMLAIMKFCKEGKEVAHVISQRDASRYNARELDRQFASVGIAGPPRCATFQGENPVPCADCPWLGQVNSPIEIPGKLIPTLESKLIPFENEDFRVIPGEGLFHIHYPETRRNQQQREPVIYKINRNEFYITEVQADTEGIQEKLYIQLKVRSPGQAPRSVYFSVDEHYGQFNFPKWLANHRLLPIKRKYNDLMSDFMSSYIERLQDNVTCEQKSHFGWSSYYDSKIGDKVDSFVVGTSMLTPDGETKVALNPKCRVMADREFQVKGDLEAWKVIPDMYKTLDQKEAQLFMCGSFAAPFMRYGLGTAKNLILSMWDAKGGKGKSTLLQAINSVWGHPINMSCSKNDTMSARFQVLSARKNLPFCLDELTTMKEDDLSPLLFDIANGQERRKSGRSGDVLLSTGDWSTITFVTSNRSIYELMRAQSSQTTAESMRVVELPCAFRNYAGTELGGYIEDCLWLLHNNYGLAGPAFMAECFKNPQYFEEVAAEARAWDAVQRQTSEERFWSYGLGTILAVGRLAVRLGYLNYDMDALESWVVKTLFPEIRHKISDGLKSAVNLLGEYYTSNINKVLVVTAAERTTEIRPHMSIQMDTYVKRYPANSLAMRLEIDTQTLYVRLNSISEWCINQRVSWSEMKTQLVNENIWDGKTSQINLAKDVETLGRVSVCCLKLDLSKCEPLACLNEQGEIYDSN